MNLQTLFLGAFAACAIALPAFAAEGVPEMLNVRWGKNAFNFESMPSGPSALRNLSRLPNGKSNAGQLVGDYTNPILKPEAAAIVKKNGEISLSGRAFPDPDSQCRLNPVPYIVWNFFLQILQQPDKVTLVYQHDSDTRHVRLNGQHPATVVPSRRSKP